MRRRAVGTSVIIADLDLRILHVEGPAFAGDGVQPEARTARSLSDVVPADLLSELEPRYRAALGGEPQCFDCRSADGRDVYTVQITPVHGGDGALTSVVAVMQDITDWLGTIDDLSRSEARLGAAERMVGVGGWEMMSETGVITYSQGFARLLGLAPRETLDRARFVSMVHPEDRQILVDAHAECLSTGAVQYEYRLVTRNGPLVTLEGRAEVVRAHLGRGQYLRGAILDVTEQRAAEVERVKARQEYEAQFESDVNDALWLGRIRDAIDDDRLVLYSQPIVDLLTGETVQHELLIRMRGEDGSIIAPGEFLPIAERYGLISEIDRWVIGQAVDRAARGKPTEFNLSAASIDDPAVLRELASAIEKTGTDPSLLSVEVTETAMMNQLDAGRRFAEQVAALGCRLVLDDFGTGFASLSYLKRIPAQPLKIDIEFVRDLVDSETDERLVRGIIGIAREFDQTTIAEGIEDQATLVRLRELGVHLGQGYLFGRPEPESVATLSPPVAVTPTDRPEPELNPVTVVRQAFTAFAGRDLDTLLQLCHPDFVLRPHRSTAELTGRPAPYRGHDGIRAYARDISEVWKILRLTPTAFRAVAESVIVFGRVDSRSGTDTDSVHVLWIWQLRDGLITSVEVFETHAAARPQRVPDVLGQVA